MGVSVKGRWSTISSEFLREYAPGQYSELRAMKSCETYMKFAESVGIVKDGKLSCFVTGKTTQLSAEHVIAIGSGGTHEIGNVLPLIQGLNKGKGSIIDKLPKYLEKGQITKEQMNNAFAIIKRWQKLHGFNIDADFAKKKAFIAMELRSMYESFAAEAGEKFVSEFYG